MKLGLFAISVVMLVLFTSVSAAAKADFSGTWVLDKSRSEGLPPGMDQTMTVTQKGDRVDIETKVVAEQGEQVVKDSYVLDGKETQFTPPVLNGGSGRGGKRTSKPTAEGNGFDVAEEATIDGAEGEATIKGTRRWRLSADGKTLTIEMALESEKGAIATKRVLGKK